jgi:hypothetical protein
LKIRTDPWLEAIMTQFGISQLGISTRGLRYWALLR